ncbi:hypothetical protein KO465_07660 [Candidatus Micrarchaeota archaeon]|nr:hypothetical protein [Candidatus Micrarchaeota archaeon]
MSIQKEFLLLRYSDILAIKTIEEHNNVLEERGFCWFGRFGKKPSQKYIDTFLGLNDPHIVLYSKLRGQGIAYYCKCEDVSYSRPKDAFPKYYFEVLFGTEKEPVVYFKLTSIERIDADVLEDYVVASSEKELVHDLNKSLSSFFLVKHKDLPRKPKVIKKEKGKPPRVANSKLCIYKKEGYCNNKRCINYKYECTRPQYCLKQKIQKEK